jgi:FkbM family methyltransferase
MNRIVDLQTHKIPPFVVNPNAETRYGSAFWDDVLEGRWEREQLSQLVELTATGKRFVDIGASNGVYSLVMAAKGCDVIAIEPDEEQFWALKENVALNPRFSIETLRGFVSAGPGIQLSPYAIDKSQNRVDGLPIIELKTLIQSEISTIIKVDIEGGEWQLLRDKSNRRLLTKSSDLTIFLSPHLGFFSSRYHQGLWQRVLFRFGVLRELLTLFKIAFIADYAIYETQEISPWQLLRKDRIFGGEGIKSHIILKFSR